jgi:hypothetical protein
MAEAAMGLKVWTESRPQTALSWFPRIIRVEAADSLVMVSPDYREGFKSANFLNDFVRRGAVANQIAEKNEMVNLSSLDKFMKRNIRF